MTIRIFLTLFSFLLICSKVDADIIGSSNEIEAPRTSGRIILSSNYHTHTHQIHSYALENRRRKRKKIKIRNALTHGLIAFDIVTISGTSCWKVWNKYSGGTHMIIRAVGEIEPGWTIRAVELMTDCY